MFKYVFKIIFSLFFLIFCFVQRTLVGGDSVVFLSPLLLGCRCSNKARCLQDVAAAVVVAIPPTFWVASFFA